MNGKDALQEGILPFLPKPRLLLVEDHPAEQAFYLELLRTEYEVQLAADGEEAWEVMRGPLPDLILADVLLPNLDGIALTRRLRADTRTASVAVILMTASYEQVLLLQGLEAGTDDFLPKPLRPLELLARLRRQRQMIALRLHAAEEIARLAAVEVERAKNDFLANLSHELRTPLTPIHFALHSLQRKPGLPSDVYEGLEMIRRNVEAQTLFINDLLSASQTASHVALAPQVTDKPGQGLRVIVADDHEWIRRILVDVVSQTLPAASVIETKDGMEAFEAYEQGGCDFLVTNHHMPRMHGMDLIRRVRQHAPDLPVLMVSVHPEARADALAAGADWFLTKEQIMEHLPALLLKHAGAKVSART